MKRHIWSSILCDAVMCGIVFGYFLKNIPLAIVVFLVNEFVYMIGWLVTGRLKWDEEREKEDEQGKEHTRVD